MSARRATAVSLAGLGVAACAGAALGQTLPGVADEPQLRDGMLVYPPGAAIPRNMTEVERRYWEQNPPFMPRTYDPPTGPVHCAAEYEPMQAILLSWNGVPGWLTIVTQMANRITRFGDAQAWVVVRDAATETTARNQMTTGNVDMTKVRFFRRTLDTIWIRDYGPRYIFQGDCRAIVDHVYNRPRPNDDALPAWLGGQLRQPVYQLPLIHGGGNYHLDALDRSYATRLVANENPSLTEPEIIGEWRDFQSVETHLFDPFPTSVDSTQHLDMWVQVLGDHKVMVSDWPLNAGSTQDVICDNAAAYLASQGYQVFRIPAFSLGGTHYTFTNTVMCNGIILIPGYTQSTVATYNAQALSTWQSAAPDKTVYQIPCQSIVTSAGVMHCIAMHVPRPRGGEIPTAYVIGPDGGEHLAASTPVTIRWASDDDVATTTADVLLSTDGGATFGTVLASGIADAGSLTWTTPAGYHGRCRVKVVVRDADGHEGSDVSDGDFAVGDCPADFNRDGFADFFDYDAFVACFEGASPPDCPEGASPDVNGDGFVDFFDYDDFVLAFETGC